VSASPRRSGRCSAEAMPAPGRTGSSPKKSVGDLPRQTSGDSRDVFQGAFRKKKLLPRGLSSDKLIYIDQVVFLGFMKSGRPDLGRGKFLLEDQGHAHLKTDAQRGGSRARDVLRPAGRRRNPRGSEDRLPEDQPPRHRPAGRHDRESPGEPGDQGRLGRVHRRAPLVEALNAGAIDLGWTGDAPPISASPPDRPSPTSPPFPPMARARPSSPSPKAASRPSPTSRAAPSPSARALAPTTCSSRRWRTRA
jgi:hypothetical protein